MLWMLLRRGNTLTNFALLLFPSLVCNYFVFEFKKLTSCTWQHQICFSFNVMFHCRKALTRLTNLTCLPTTSIKQLNTHLFSIYIYIIYIYIIYIWYMVFKKKNIDFNIFFPKASSVKLNFLTCYIYILIHIQKHI